MDVHSDDDEHHDSVKLEHSAPAANVLQRFDLDDAFSDGDDLDTSLEFSSAAIREELARHRMTEDGVGESGHLKSFNGYAVHGSVHNNLADESVSDIDIGQRALDLPDISPSPSLQAAGLSGELQSTPTFEDGASILSELSHVSLSSSHSADSHHESLGVIDASASDQVQVLPENDAPEDEHVLETSSLPPLPVTPVPHSHARSESQATESQATSRPSSSSEHASSPPVSASISHLPPLSPSLSQSNSRPRTPVSRASSSSDARPHVHHSTGPTALQKVVSKTRPPFLPPKTRKEDVKHMKDWETMMKQSRSAEEKRRRTLEERRLARERKIEESSYIWERELVPDWRMVYKRPHLRKLWWKGIPTKVRATMWEKAVGNGLALSKDNYRTCHARAQRALSSGTFPAAILILIEEDISSTLPSVRVFDPQSGPLHDDLKDMLCAWVVARRDEGLGYVTGIAKIAGMFLITMPAERGFIVMRNLLERHLLRSFYGGTASKDDVEAYYRIFDTLLADGMPKIYFNFKQHHISPSSYLPDWLFPLFLDHLPFEACARIWDVLLLEGDSFLYRASLGILSVLESRLFFPDRTELLELLKGQNKAAIEVAKRDGQHMDGGLYEIYGVDEETLWDRIDAMDEWWKESTWKRLTQRELPDL